MGYDVHKRLREAKCLDNVRCVVLRAARYDTEGLFLPENLDIAIGQLAFCADEAE